MVLKDEEGAHLSSPYIVLALDEVLLVSVIHQTRHVIDALVVLQVEEDINEVAQCLQEEEVRVWVCCQKELKLATAYVLVVKVNARRDLSGMQVLQRHHELLALYEPTMNE